MERLDKVLSNLGEGSRRDVRMLIKKGQVTVDGVVVRDPEMKIDPEQVKLCLNGRTLSYQKYIYILMHKPAGLLSATRDPKTPTVLSLLPEKLQKQGLFPAGRLDKDSEGLLLLTNDGDTAHRLISPNFHVEKLYYVRYDGDLAHDSEQRFRDGITIDGGEKCRTAHLERLAPGEAHVRVTEGKYHQVKRMIAAVGGEVTYLRRLSFGPLTLDESLSPGEFRFLKVEEERDILKIRDKQSGKVDEE